MRDAAPGSVRRAARVGGISANAAYPADFIYDNIAITTNIIHGAHLVGARDWRSWDPPASIPSAEQPIQEASLLTGPLEPTNEAMPCQNRRRGAVPILPRQHGDHFIAPIPTNLFGPGDNFDPAASHVGSGDDPQVEEAKRTAARSPSGALVHPRANSCLSTMPPMRSCSSCSTTMATLDQYRTGDDVSIKQLAQLVATSSVHRAIRIRHQQARRHAAQTARQRPSHGACWRGSMNLLEGLRQTSRGITPTANPDCCAPANPRPETSCHPHFTVNRC